MGTNVELSVMTFSNSSAYKTGSFLENTILKVSAKPCFYVWE